MSVHLIPPVQPSCGPTGICPTPTPPPKPPPSVHVPLSPPPTKSEPQPQPPNFPTASQSVIRQQQTAGPGCCRFAGQPKCRPSFSSSSLQAASCLPADHFRGPFR